MFQSTIFLFSLTLLFTLSFCSKIKIGETEVLINETSNLYTVSTPSLQSRSLPLKTHVRLHHAIINTNEQTKIPFPSNSEHLLDLKPSNKIFIIQFVVQALEVFKKDIKEKISPQIEFLYPLQDFSYIISLPSPALQSSLIDLEYVKFLHPFHPSFKVQEEILDQLKPSFSSKYNVMTVKNEDQIEVEKLIQNVGGYVFYTNLKGRRLSAALNFEQLRTVLVSDKVMFVDLWSQPEDDMDIARVISGAEYLATSPTPTYTGKGVRAEVCDSGLRTTHRDFEYLGDNLILHGPNGASWSHGTSVFGIVFGNGEVNSKGKGVLFEAEAGVIASYSYLTDRYTHTEELVDPNDIYKCVFQTNSWGGGRTRSYTSVSREMDDIIYKTDLAIFQSQSNAGNQDSRPEAWAKNIISIGGIKHLDTLTRTDDRWTNGGSTGPAADGRIKPDLAHFYDHIYTTSSTSDTSYTPTFGGTSGATPITSGHSGLLYEMWADGVFDGAPGKNRDVFESRPHASTVKAMLMNTAYQYEFSGTSHDFSRYHQGFGMVQLDLLYDLAKDNGYRLPVLVDESSPLGPMESDEYDVTVPNAVNPSFFRATLVYRDPPNTPSAQKQLVNDLNLQVVSPNGNVYWGNAGLISSTQSTAGSDPNLADDTNNVENVIIASAPAGDWKVFVFADEVNQVDPVPYSLVVTFGAVA